MTTIKPITLRDLSFGERLMLQRERRGFSQAAIAELYGVTLYQYRRVELSKELELDEPGDRALVDRVLASARKEMRALGKLKRYEVCLVRRRRAGMTARELAPKVGVTRQWLSRMESGREPIDRLEAWWFSRDALRRARAKG